MSTPTDFQEGPFPGTAGGAERPAPEPPPLSPKKRRILYISMIAFLLLFPMISFLAQGGDRPFQALEADQIASALVELDPTGASASLDAQAIADLVSVLQATKIYQEDESYQTASGQFVTFTFTLADGAEYIVSACAPMW